jgi:hypothetical protein
VAKCLWTGIVNGVKSELYDDGHTRQMADFGCWRRTSDSSEIVATCVRQLIEAGRTANEELRRRPRRN